MKDYDQTIADRIRSFLEEEDWHYTFDEECGNFRFGLALDESSLNASFLVDVKNDMYITYAILPISANQNNEDMMRRMHEFICRVNYKLLLGGFEFDVRDGEIRYRCTVDCEDAELSNAVIRNSIYIPANMIIKFSAGLISIMFAGKSAAEAYEACKLNDD